MGRYGIWRPVDRYQFGTLQKPMRARRLIFHTAVSSAESMHGFFNTPGQATPHFYVNDAGVIEQYIDTHYQSTANLDGNHDCITVESSDEGGHRLSWTEAQVVALAKLAVWCHNVHGIPLRVLPSSRPGTTGVGWHRLGIDGNFPDGLLGGRVEGGEHWSLSTGKICPGDDKIRGTVDRILPLARQIRDGDEPMQEADFKRIAADVRAALVPLRRRMNEIADANRLRDAAILTAVTDDELTPFEVRQQVRVALERHAAAVAAAEAAEEAAE